MQRIVVLGGGESGAGAAVLAKVKGFDVFLSDNGKIKEEMKELLTPSLYIGRCPEQVQNLVDKVRPLLSGVSKASAEINL